MQIKEEKGEYKEKHDDDENMEQKQKYMILDKQSLIDR